MEKWSNDDAIPYDDIDTQKLFEATANLFPQFLLDEEEDGGIPINPANFSSKYYKNKKLMKDRIWSDLGIPDRFNETKQGDQTILKPLHHSRAESIDQLKDESKYDESKLEDEFNIAHFLTNGYGPSDGIDNMLTSNDLVNDSIMGNNSDISINLNTDFIPPNFPVPKRNNSNGNVNYGHQTPRVRPRQPSNDRSYQTPIGRIRRDFTE